MNFLHIIIKVDSKLTTYFSGIGWPIVVDKMGLFDRSLASHRREKVEDMESNHTYYVGTYITNICSHNIDFILPSHLTKTNIAKYVLFSDKDFFWQRLNQKPKSLSTKKIITYSFYFIINNSIKGMSYTYHYY